MTGSGHVGRNDPCPCGSGKKYKQCHLDADRTAGCSGSNAPVHTRDRQLVQAMLEHAVDRARAATRRALETLDLADSSTAQLLAPWSVYHVRIAGRTMAERFVDEAGDHLDLDELRWIDAQRTAWLSVWEVLDATPGERIALGLATTLAP